LKKIWNLVVLFFGTACLDRVGRSRDRLAANEKQLAASKCDELIDF